MLNTHLFLEEIVLCCQEYRICNFAKYPQKLISVVLKRCSEVQFSIFFLQVLWHHLEAVDGRDDEDDVAPALG